MQANFWLRSTKTILISCFIFSVFLFTVNCNAQRETIKKQNRKMFGVTLSSESTKLLLEVEDLYKQSVREEIADSWELSRQGESKLSMEGIPIIQVNSISGRKESTIVHELFHLKLKTKGFPIIAWKFPPGQKTPSNIEFVSWLRKFVMDPLQHYIFYPEMRELGIMPDSFEKAEFEQAILDNNFKGINEASKNLTITLYYLKALLEFTDHDLLVRIGSWYEKNGWHSQLKLGKEFYEKVIESKPINPQNISTVFLQIINSLCQDSAYFEFQELGSRTMGAFKEPLVVIKVLPPK